MSTSSEDPPRGFFSDVDVCEDDKGPDGSFRSEPFSVKDAFDPVLRTAVLVSASSLCSPRAEIGRARSCVDDVSVWLILCWGEKHAGLPLASRSLLISPGDAKSLNFFEGEAGPRALSARLGDPRELSLGLFAVAGDMHVSEDDGANTVTGRPP